MGLAAAAAAAATAAAAGVAVGASLAADLRTVDAVAGLRAHRHLARLVRVWGCSLYIGFQSKLSTVSVKLRM